MRARGAVAFGVALVAFLAVGLWLGGHPAKLPGFAREAFTEEPTSLVAEAAEMIKDNYFRKVGNTELGNASLQGMVRELRRRHNDRFSDYFSPESLEGFNQQIEGRFSGIGLSVVAGQERGCGWSRSSTARRPTRAGSRPATRSSRSTANRSPGSTSDRSDDEDQGPGRERGDGRRARRAKTHKTREKTLTRAEVELPERQQPGLRPSTARRSATCGCSSFSEARTSSSPRGSKRWRAKGPKGSSSTCATTRAGCSTRRCERRLFLPEGEVVVTTKSRTKGDSDHEDRRRQIVEVPCDVLIDRGTASAAEILTAALDDDGDATVVGTRSYGKGVFQEEHDLANGGALKLTVGEYFTPDGENLARTGGIHPEVKAVDNPQTAVDEARQKALETVAAQVAG